MTARRQKITFAEMRDMGVRGLLIYCSDYKCSHLITISGRWPDELRLSDFELCFICSACGKRGADVRPNLRACIFVTDPMGSAHNRVTDILRTVLGSIWQWAGAFFLLRGTIAARRPEWERLVAFIGFGRRHRYDGTGRSQPRIENRRPTDLSESRFVIEGPKHLHSVSNPGAIVWERYSRNCLRLRWLSTSRIGSGSIECLIHSRAASLN
jgi:hypothetical protein